MASYPGVDTRTVGHARKAGLKKHIQMLEVIATQHRALSEEFNAMREQHEQLVHKYRAACQVVSEREKEIEDTRRELMSVRYRVSCLEGQRDILNQKDA